MCADVVKLFRLELLDAPNLDAGSLTGVGEGLFSSGGFVTEILVIVRSNAGEIGECPFVVVMWDGGGRGEG